ncbi:NADH flavin oxidoreductase NADH oxidase [Agrilactobacillus composti DSM 18527 = JCM 14202]|uniref:NADH flavin oxidoreductase NADH oxidase n=1 Tax=Agrilactobacillus composti DSM 18527 = JCM 14202 TaxID=1423734 RepID=A0A0R1XUL9_9LACO|nr:FAD-dependent oxidoreductase [Agrilactobacillus composti]KRM30870.1 NADH flavin oxidoreductase NADH oxidase [Agrilactobacillus composti DSM 18527 = JCM 14202]
MPEFDKLFTLGHIGKLAIKNRVVMPAIGVNLARLNGEASNDIIRYYEERAKGGVGLIITEITRIDDETGVGTLKQLSVTSPAVLPQLQRLVDTVHKYDCKLFIQLHHPGRETSSRLLGGQQMVAPSAIADKQVQEVPRALTVAEIKDLIQKFINGATIAQAAGADGVELHAAHGYLLNEFLSPYANRRSDQYGGSLENRLRILHEIITGIKAACGADLPISVRISADEFVEGGLKIEDSIAIAQALEDYGADAINVSSGIYESQQTIIEPGNYPQGWKANLGTAIKKQVKIPVIAVDNIKTPAVAEQLLADGASDFVGIARANLADPNWTLKAKHGQANQITICIGCLLCIQAVMQGKHVVCAVNPRLGREREFSHLPKNGAGQTVAIIGGGPGGLAAAETLADRNFQVELFEQRPKLGGALTIASVPAHKEKIALFEQQLINQVQIRDNIHFHLGEKATVTGIQGLSPVGVFLATGARSIIPDLPGIHGDHVVTAEGYLAGQEPVKGSVVVIGSGMTGLEVAMKLATEGHQITIAEMQQKVGPGADSAAIAGIMAGLSHFEPTIMTDERLTAVTAAGVTLVNGTTGETTTVAADTVVLALGVHPDEAAMAPFVQAFADLKLIGDANLGRSIADAMKDGFTKAAAFNTYQPV